MTAAAEHAAQTTSRTDRHERVRHEEARVEQPDAEVALDLPPGRAESPTPAPRTEPDELADARAQLAVSRRYERGENSARRAATVPGGITLRRICRATTCGHAQHCTGQPEVISEKRPCAPHRRRHQMNRKSAGLQHATHLE